MLERRGSDPVFVTTFANEKLIEVISFGDKPLYQRAEYFSKKPWTTR
jgi:hypothetical protein